MATLKLQPYVGGAGPSRAQADHNTKVLGQELQRLKIPFVETREWAKKMWDGDSLDLKIVHPKTKIIIFVGYDRWGFCVDSEGKFSKMTSVIDQWGLDNTTHWIEEWYKK